jgi:hypothetical protein
MRHVQCEGSGSRHAVEHGAGSIRIDGLVRQGLRARHDPRAVLANPHARYFGAELGEGSLVPGAGARLGATRFADWLRQPGPPVPPPAQPAQPVAQS